MTRHGEPGQSAILGATVVDGGVNFSLFSGSETGVEPLRFDSAGRWRAYSCAWSGAIRTWDPVAYSSNARPTGGARSESRIRLLPIDRGAYK
jgi:hypothetical protein